MIKKFRKGNEIVRRNSILNINWNSVTLITLLSVKNVFVKTVLCISKENIQEKLNLRTKLQDSTSSYKIHLQKNFKNPK